jgi:hypothetical protein
MRVAGAISPPREKNMTRIEIQKQAYARMSHIEDHYHDYVPPDVQSYWLLNYMIAEGIRAYVGSYGLRHLDVGDCNDGREEIGLGHLSPFERDAIALLNDHCEKADRHYERSRQRTQLNSR